MNDTTAEQATALVKTGKDSTFLVTGNGVNEKNYAGTAMSFEDARALKNADDEEIVREYFSPEEIDAAIKWAVKEQHGSVIIACKGTLSEHSPAYLILKKALISVKSSIIDGVRIDDNIWELDKNKWFNQGGFSKEYIEQKIDRNRTNMYNIVISFKKDYLNPHKNLEQNQEEIQELSFWRQALNIIPALKQETIIETPLLENDHADTQDLIERFEFSFDSISERGTLMPDLDLKTGIERLSSAVNEMRHILLTQDKDLTDYAPAINAIHHMEMLTVSFERHERKQRIEPLETGIISELQNDFANVVMRLENKVAHTKELINSAAWQSRLTLQVSEKLDL